jgi:hypothetical protein
VAVPLAPADAALPLEPAAALLPADALRGGTRVPSHMVFAPGRMSMHPMPKAVASMPQMLLAATQQALPSVIIVAGQLGASGAGAVQVPETA